MHPTPETTNYYRGVYYMTSEAAAQAASYYTGSQIGRARRGFYVLLADGSKLGPATDSRLRKDTEQMPKRFRVYIEETSTRLMWRDVDADTREDAEAIAQEALDGDEWTEWDCSSSDASLEVREELTAELDAHGKETRVNQ